MTAGFDAVLFDMDGVTVETAKAWRDLERTTILPAATNGTAPPDAIRALSVGDAYDRLVRMDDVEVTVDETGYAALYEAHAEEVYLERARLMDGYVEVLETIREANVSTGLVSASRGAWVDMVLERFDLHDVYETVVSSSDIDGPSKPAPTPYLVAADDLGADPAQCLAVEDSPHGIDAAVAAGMDCLALRGAANTDSDLSAADAIVTSPEELHEWITVRL